MGNLLRDQALPRLENLMMAGGFNSYILLGISALLFRICCSQINYQMDRQSPCRPFFFYCHFLTRVLTYHLISRIVHGVTSIASVTIKKWYIPKPVICQQADVRFSFIRLQLDAEDGFRSMTTEIPVVGRNVQQESRISSRHRDSSGEIAAKVLGSAAPSSVPPVAPCKVEYSLNLATARQLKIVFPEELVRGARRVY
jgi:sulfite exporter TauE/SafE